MKDLITLPVPGNALEIFQCDKAEEIVSRIEAEARSIVPDLSTDKGRKAIASTARKVAKSKIALDSLGKDLVADWKTKAKGVDIERKLIRDRLDALRDEVRQPLTDWEDNEKARVESERAAAELLRDHERALDENSLFDRQREIERKEAEQAKAEADRIEREQAAQAEADRIANDKRIAAEATERANREAAEQVRAAEDAMKQAELEKVEAEQRAKIQAEQALQDKAEAEQRERDRIKQAEIDKKEAAERARQAEIDRQNEELEQQERADAKRKADREHASKILGEAKKDLILNGLPESLAKEVVLAIAKGKIKNVTITY